MTDKREWVLVPRELLEEARNIAMEWTLKGRVPECGQFGQIAQDLDAMLAAKRTAPPSAPVGVEELIEDWESALAEDKRDGVSEVAIRVQEIHLDQLRALAQQPAAEYADADALIAALAAQPGGSDNDR